MLNHNNLLLASQTDIINPFNIDVYFIYSIFEQQAFYLMGIEYNNDISTDGAFSPVIYPPSMYISLYSDYESIPITKWKIANQYPYYVAGLFFYQLIINFESLNNNAKTALKTFIKDLGDNYFKTANTFYTSKTPLRFTPPAGLDLTDFINDFEDGTVIHSNNYVLYEVYDFCKSIE